MSLVERRHSMGAYPVTLTDNGFMLHGQEFASKPIIGERGAAGQRAHAMPVKAGGAGRQWVIISSGNQRQSLLNPYDFRRRITAGEWMQAEGNYRLGQAGRTPMNGPTGVEVALALGLDIQEIDGMARYLGAVAAGGMYISACYVSDEGLDHFVSVRFRACRLVESQEEVWVFDLPCSDTNPNNVPCHTRANLFWDETNRILTAVDNWIWSVRIPGDGSPPTEYGITPVVTAALYDGTIVRHQHCSVVNGMMLLQKYIESLEPVVYQGPFVMRRNNDLTWSIAGNPNLNEPDLITGLSRPWPYNADSNHWKVLSRPALQQPDFITVNASNGSTSLGFVAADDPVRINIETLMAAADAEFGALAEGLGPYPYTNIACERDHLDFPDPYFKHWEWVGRSSTVESDEIAGGYNLICPRTTGLGPSGSYFSWTPEVGSIPAFRADSEGNLIYAVIEKVPVLTRGMKARVSVASTPITVWQTYGFSVGANHTGSGLPELLDRSGWTYYLNEPSLVDYTTAYYEGGLYAAAPVDGFLLNYEDSHHPREAHGHRTILRKLSSGGDILWSLDLSSGPFVGNASGMTEELPFPENVYEIKLGPEHIYGSDPDWDDAIFLLQGHRENRDDPGSLPCFRVVSKAGEIISSLIGLGVDAVSEDHLAASSIDFTTTEDGTSEFVVRHPTHGVPWTVTNVYLNDVAQDISDGGTNYVVADGHDNKYHVGFATVTGDVVRFSYNYTIPADPTHYDMEILDVCLAVNISPTPPPVIVPPVDTPTTGGRWALVGVYSRSRTAFFNRTDIFVLDLHDLTNVTIHNQFTAVGSAIFAYPQPADFDHFVFTSGGVFWIGNQFTSGPNWLKFT